MGARDQGLVHADVRARIAPHEEGAAHQRELHLLAVGAQPDQVRAHDPPRRPAKGATAGPSLSNNVASLNPAAAR